MTQRSRAAVSRSWKRLYRRRSGCAAAPTNASYAGAAYHHSSAPTSAPARNLSTLRMHARRPDVEERDGRAADDGLPDRQVEEIGRKGGGFFFFFRGSEARGGGGGGGG